MHVQPSHKSRVTDCLLCASLLSFLPSFSVLGGKDEGRGRPPRGLGTQMNVCVCVLPSACCPLRALPATCTYHAVQWNFGTIKCPACCIACYAGLPLPNHL